MGFLAHLIAMAVQAPQTRTRRRAEPAQAVAAYRALGQWPMAPGGSVRRSLSNGRIGGNLAGNAWPGP